MQCSDREDRPQVQIFGERASESLDLHYRSGAEAGTVSLNMMADDRGGDPGECTVAGTAIHS